MDNKRHPSSFQQLEKLGEGTYATVRSQIGHYYPLLTAARSSKVEIDRLENM
jgi:hypothetical protein